MTNGPDTSEFLTAGGPSKVSLKPHYPDEDKKGDPDRWEGTGTYTIGNKSDEVLNVLVNATLAPAGAAEGAAQTLNLPADAISVDKARITLHPKENEQAKVDLRVPPQADSEKAVLSVVFKDELRPELISASYDSTVTLEKGKQDGSKLKWLLLILAALVVIGGGVAAAVIFWPSSDDGGTVPVPEGLVGKTVAEATTALAAACTEPQPCLTPTAESEQSSEVGHGLVISTDPEAGKKVDPGDTVTLVVSLGQPVTLPPVEGKNVNAATDELQALCQPASPVPCLSITVLRAASDTITLNDAIKTEPAAGESVNPGATVKLYVSNTLKGSLKVPWQATADIDDGMIKPANDDADIWFNRLGSTLESGYPDLWAARFLPPITPKAQGYEKCKQLSGGSDGETKLALASLTDGDHVCIRTSRKNVGELEILSQSFAELRVAYTVWVSQSRCKFGICVKIQPGINIGPKIVDLGNP